MAKKGPRTIRQILSVDDLEREREKIGKMLVGESPLACAVVGTAFLEMALTTLLRAYFVEARPEGCDDQKDERTAVPNDLFDENKGGLLVELVPKANVAFCLGLMSRDSLRHVKNIARIRNRFAHSYDDLDFHTDDEIRGLCAGLRFVVLVILNDAATHAGTIDDWLRRNQETGEIDLDQEPRSRFIAMVQGLSIQFLLTSLQVSHRKQVPNEPEHWKAGDRFEED